MSSSRKYKKQKKTEKHDIYEVIVTGYIRNIQQILQKKQLIIPQEIYQTCYQYYYNAITIFAAVSMQQFYLLDMDGKKLSEAIHLTEFGMNSPCYIPNISHLLSKSIKGIKSNQFYDGIFGYAYELQKKFKNKNMDFLSLQLKYPGQTLYKLFPCLILYKPSVFFHNHKFQYQLKSTKYLPTDNADHLLYCGYRNGIIYQDNTKLYQLKFQNIKSKRKFVFKEIIVNKHNTRKAMPYSSIIYMNKQNKLFAVAISDRTVQIGPCMVPSIRKRSVRCGMFDFDNNEWITMPSFTYEKNVNGFYFNCKTCYDDMNDLVYMVTSMGDTAKYDFRKQKWKLLYDGNILLQHEDVHIDSFGHSNSILWIDKRHPDMLYSVLPRQKYVANIISMPTGLNERLKHEIVYKCFDLRSNKWNVGVLFPFPTDNQLNVFC
eukprot:91767_1